MIRRPQRDPDFDDAFARLFPRALRLADRILANRAAAEDVAAEALARTCLRWPQLRDNAYLDAWVLRVAANLAIDATRRRAPRLEPETTLEHEDVTTSRVVLVEALRRLPRRQRDVVVLRHITGHSDAETAETLGISMNTVRTHLDRAMAALRRMVGPGFDEEGSLAPRT